jgi:hypothetical protein
MFLTTLGAYDKHWLVPQIRGFPFHLTSLQHEAHHPATGNIPVEHQIRVSFPVHEPF